MSMDKTVNRETFSFRGNALHRICRVSKKVDITTKTTHDTTGTVCSFTSNGSVSVNSPPGFKNGTRVTVIESFYHDHFKPQRKELTSGYDGQYKVELFSLTLLVSFYEISVLVITDPSLDILEGIKYGIRAENRRTTEPCLAGSSLSHRILGHDDRTAINHWLAGEELYTLDICSPFVARYHYLSSL